MRAAKLKKELLLIADDDGTSNCTGSLRGFFHEQLKSQRAVKGIKNADLSHIIANLLDLFELLEERLKNSQRQNWGGLKKPTPAHQFIKELKLNKLREKRDEQICELNRQNGRC